MARSVLRGVKTDFPGGNGIVEEFDGGRVVIRPDMRDSTGEWFYWNVRMKFAVAGNVEVEVGDAQCLGSRGPAVWDETKHVWEWLGPCGIGATKFALTSRRDEWLHLSATIPYQVAQLRQLERRLTETAGIEISTLCKSRHGQDVSMWRLRPSSRGGRRGKVLVTCRHHACESLASYELAGFALWWSEQLRMSRDTEYEDDLPEVVVIPMMDIDGVEEGDQGKNRQPHDHNRDYLGDSIYPEVRALREASWLRDEGDWLVALDLHCPYLAGPGNEVIHFVESGQGRWGAEYESFTRLLNRRCEGRRAQGASLPYVTKNDLHYGDFWNNAANGGRGSFSSWAADLSEGIFATTIELPYSNASGVEVNARSAQEFGADLAWTVLRYANS